jgi:hypothetical protein
MKRIIEKNYKLRSGLAAAGGGLALLTATLGAAPFAYNSGDLILGFRQVNGPAPDLVVNIGQASIYDAVAPGQSLVVGNLSANQLNTAFPDLNEINWSVTGAVRGLGDPNYPAQTIWATAARTDTNVQSVPWLRRNQYGQGGPASQFAAVGNNATTYSSVQPASPTNTTTGVVIPLSDPNAYTPLVQNQDNQSASDFNGNFQGSVENTTPVGFTSLEPLSRSDLYELIPGTTAGGTVNTPGKWVGYFDLTPDGTLTFTAATTAPPRPTITGVQRSGNVATVSFTTANSVTYRLRATNTAGLTTPVATWSTSGVTVTGNGSVQSLQDTNASDIRFYAVEAYY